MVIITASEHDLVRLIKVISEEARKNEMPCNVVVGKVINDNPLQVQINQRLILSKNQLVVPELLTNHDIVLKIGSTQTTYKMINALKLNDELIMIADEGGQTYYVIDRKGVIN